MFVNFMDMLRNINKNLYPNMVTLEQSAHDSADSASTSKNDAITASNNAEASKRTAEHYATSSPNTVKEVTWNGTDFVETDTQKYSAKYWAEQNESSRIDFTNLLHTVEAKEQSVESIVYQDGDGDVIEFTWNETTQAFEQTVQYGKKSIKYFYDKIRATDFTNKEKHNIINIVQGKHDFEFPFSITSDTDIFVNGLLRLEGDDYVVDNSNNHRIIFEDGKNINDRITAVKNSSVLVPLELNNAMVREPKFVEHSFVASNQQSVFIVNNASITNCTIYIDRLYIGVDEYVLGYNGGGTTITFNEQLNEGAVVKIVSIEAQ